MLSCLLISILLEFHLWRLCNTSEGALSGRDCCTAILVSVHCHVLLWGDVQETETKYTQRLKKGEIKILLIAITSLLDTAQW